MLKKEALLKKTSNYLSRLSEYIDMNNTLRFFDINISAETFFCELLNIVYDLKLIDLNTENQNYAAIDLGDKDKRIAIQVTSDNTSTKLKKTIEKFLAHEQHKHFDSLKVLILTSKKKYTTKFDTTGKLKFSKKDIFDKKDLLKKISQLKLDRIQLIVDFLDKNLQSEDHAILKSIEEKVDNSSAQIASLTDDLQELAERQEKHVSHNEKLLQIDGLLKSQIEKADCLRREGSITKAIDSLKEMKDSQFNLLSGEDKYKLYINIGLCYLDLEESKEAIGYFFSGYNFFPDTPKSLSMLSLAYWIKGDEEKASEIADKAISQDPETQNAYVVKFSIDDPNSLDEGISNAPKSILESPAVLHAISHRYLDDSQYQKAVDYITQAVSLSESDLYKNIYRGFLGACMMRLALSTDSLNKKNLIVRSHPTIEKAAIELESAWTFLCKLEGSKRYYHILFNLASAHKLLGNYEKSIILFNDYIDLESNNPDAYREVGIIFLQQRSYEEALRYFNLAIEKNSSDKVLELFLAQSYLHLKKEQSAASIASNLIGTPTTDKVQISALQILCDCNAFLKSSGYHHKIISCLSEKIDDFKKLIILSKSFLNIGETEISAEFAFRSLDFAEKADHGILFYSYEHFKSLKMTVEACLILEFIVDGEYDDCLPVYELARTYYDLEYYAEAIRVCKSVRENNPLRESFFSIELNSYNYVKNSKEAQILLKLAHQSMPEDLEIEFLLLQCYMNSLDTESLRSHFDRVDYRKYVDLKLEEAYRVCAFYEYIGDVQKSLQLAYLLRSVYPQSDEAHAKYIALFNQVDETLLSPILNRDLISGDSAITVKSSDSGISSTFLIVAEKTNQNGEVEHLLKEDFANTLIGKNIGFEYELKGYLGTKKFVVTEIASKYLYAYQKSVEFMQTHYSHSKYMEVAVFDKEKVKSHIVNSGDEIIKDALNLAFSEYKNQKIALPYLCRIISQLTSFSCLSTCNKIIYSDEHVFPTSNDYQMEESQYAIKSVLGKKSITLSLPSLILLFKLDIQSVFRENIQNIYVNQDILDYFRSEIYRFTIDNRKTTGHMRNTPYGIVTNTIEPGQLDDIINEYSEIIEWCEKYEVSSIDLFSLTAEYRHELLQKIHKSFLVPAIHSEINDTLLVEEDGIYRNYLKHYHNHTATNMYTMIEALYKASKIDKEKYIDCCIQLASFNSPLILSRDVLIASMEKSGYIMDKQFLKLIRFISGDYLIKEYACQVLITFLKDIFLKVNIPNNRFKIANVCITHFFHSRKINTSLIRFMYEVVEDNFESYLFIHKVELEKVIKATYRSILTS